MIPCNEILITKKFQIETIVIIAGGGGGGGGDRTMSTQENPISFTFTALIIIVTSTSNFSVINVSIQGKI